MEILAFSWTVIGRKDTDVNARGVATKVRFVSFGWGSKTEIACIIKTQTKIIKKSREYNSRDLTLALYNIDYNKKGFYCEYMDGN